MISELSSELGASETFIAHHGPPPQTNERIFDVYRDSLQDWKWSKKKHAIFDRAYPCSYILEQHRARNAGHFEEVIDLEMEISETVDQVVHLGIFRPWYWSAPHHVQELKQENPKVSKWALRDKYVSRMFEHKIYTEQLLNFYEDVTMFPNVQLHNESPSAALVLNRCFNSLQNT